METELKISSKYSQPYKEVYQPDFFLTVLYLNLL